MPLAPDPFRRLLATALLATVASCGGGDPQGPVPPPAPPPAPPPPGLGQAALAATETREDGVESNAGAETLAIFADAITTLIEASPNRAPRTPLLGWRTSRAHEQPGAVALQRLHTEIAARVATADGGDGPSRPMDVVPRRGGSDRALVRHAGSDLFETRPTRSLLRRSGAPGGPAVSHASVPTSLWGETYIWDSGRNGYVRDPNDDGSAPSNGVRFITYVTNPATGVPATPLVETGATDILDFSGVDFDVEIFSVSVIDDIPQLLVNLIGDEDIIDDGPGDLETVLFADLSDGTELLAAGLLLDPPFSYSEFTYRGFEFSSFDESLSGGGIDHEFEVTGAGFAVRYHSVFQASGTFSGEFELGGETFAVFSATFVAGQLQGFTATAPDGSQLGLSELDDILTILDADIFFADVWIFFLSYALAIL